MERLSQLSKSTFTSLTKISKNSDKDKEKEKDKDREDIMKIIEKYDYIEQNKILMLFGFRDLTQNLKRLKKVKGNVEVLMEKISSLHQIESEMFNTNNDNSEKQDQKILGMIEKIGLINENKELIKAGYTNLKLNVKALIKSKKDVNKAINMIKAYENKKQKCLNNGSNGIKNNIKGVIDEKKGKYILKKLEKYGYIMHNEYLVNHGFVNVEKNYHALKKNNGNLELTQKYLLNKTDKKAKMYDLMSMIFVSNASDIELKDGNIGIKDDGNGLKSSHLLRHNSLFKSEIIQSNSNIIKDNAPLSLKSLDNNINSNINCVYVDGNSLYLLNKSLIDLIIKHKNIEKAQGIIIDLIKTYTAFSNIISWVLIFDNVCNAEQLNECLIPINNNKLSIFSVWTISPKYHNINHAFNDWCVKRIADIKSSLFVTGDRSLINMLSQLGADNIIKPIEFFNVGTKVIGEDIIGSILSS